MNKLLNLALLSLACLLSACGLQAAGTGRQQTITPVQTVEVTIEIVPPYPSPTPVVCTPMPAGMTLSVEPFSPTAVRLEITGLQPGESITYIFHTQSDGHTVQMEGHPVTTADSNGRYVEVILGLASPLGTKHWTVQVIHSRGVACTQVDLP
jgi:hypothetical protein